MCSILNSCTPTVKIPNVEWCSSVAELGAVCQHSISDQNRQMSVKEFIEFLEAKEDNPSTPQNESKGPALCASVNDFVKIKTVIEQLCELKSSNCKYEEIQRVFKRIERLQKK